MRSGVHAAKRSKSGRRAAPARRPERRARRSGRRASCGWSRHGIAPCVTAGPPARSDPSTPGAGLDRPAGVGRPSLPRIIPQALQELGEHGVGERDACPVSMRPIHTRACAESTPLTTSIQTLVSTTITRRRDRCATCPGRRPSAPFPGDRAGRAAADGRRARAAQSTVARLVDSPVRRGPRPTARRRSRCWSACTCEYPLPCVGRLPRPRRV